MQGVEAQFQAPSGEILCNSRKEILNTKSLSSHRHLVTFVDAYRLNFRGRETEL